MTLGRDRLCRAFVLHSRAWRNTSLIVETLTRDWGRVGLVARGVRRQGRTSRAALEPFQPLLVSWRGRGELRTLAAVEAEQWWPPPPGRRLLAAFYCSELALRLLARDDPHPDVFDAYARTIAGLADDAEGDEALLRRFELELLDALGFAPPLTVEADTGGAVEGATEYDFVPEYGPVAATGPPGPDVVRVPGEHLIALENGRLNQADQLRSARRVLRASLSPHLGDRPLKSRALYRSMYGGDRGRGQ